VLGEEVGERALGGGLGPADVHDDGGLEPADGGGHLPELLAG
jgi:hypothetical protein